MKIVTGESGIDFATMTIKEWKDNQALWMGLAVFGTVVGLVLGMIVGDIHF